MREAALCGGSDAAHRHDAPWRVQGDQGRPRVIKCDRGDQVVPRGAMGRFGRGFLGENRVGRCWAHVRRLFRRFLGPFQTKEKQI